MSDDKINFSVLSDLSKESFLEELEKSEKLITKKDSKKYFEILLSHFSKSPPKTVGVNILNTIYNVICRDSILEVFMDEKFALSLPFHPKIYLEEILDIFYIIVTRSPNKITKAYVKCFETLIRHRGKKTLRLLMYYSQCFNSLNDPWPIIDLLIIGSERFSAFDTASQYVMILSLLIQSFPEFRESRCKACWDIIYQIVSNEESNDILRFAYEALAGIESFDNSNKIDYSLAIKHLRIRQIQSSVLSLLLLSPMNDEKVISSQDLIVALVRSSAKNVKATLILMNICSVSKKASQLILSDPSWIMRPLPTIIDTCRLFLIVYRQRSKGYELPKEFAAMILQINSIPGEIATNLLTIILRKVEMNQVVFDELNVTGFFEGFIQRGHDDKSTYDYLIMADTIGRFSYTTDLLAYCPLVVNAIESSPKIYEEACQVADTLIQYSKIKREFKKLKLVPILKEKLNGESTRRPARHLLKAMDEYD